MSTYKHAIQYYETDKMGITHHSNYVRWMEEARMDFLSQIGYGMKQLEADGITCTQYPFADSNDLAAITQTAADNSDVIYVPTDNTVASNTGIIDNICRPAGVPVIAGEEGICASCGVATLSISYYDLGVATGNMAAKILTGEANIEEMAIGYAETVTPKYNETICSDLGITVPEGYTAIG